MKRLLLILIYVAGIIYTHGQVVVEFSKQKKRSKIRATVQFKGASSKADTILRSYLERNLNASTVIYKSVKKGKYVVVVKYIFSKDDTLSDISCDNDPGYGMCQEIIRLMKKFTIWKPAAQNGRNVGTYRH